MRIGLVSDTHLPRFGRRLPDALVRGLREERVDLILHLGDLTTSIAADLFEELAPFDAVAGNNDGPEIVERYGRRKIVSAGGVRIGMVHGDGRGSTTLERARRTFAEDAVDVVCFGHSHVPYLERQGATWLVNPGSPTDKRRQPAYSYGVLTVTDGTAHPRLVFYEDRVTTLRGEA